MDKTVNPKELMTILKKHIILIMILTFSLSLISAFISYFYLTPTYQASTQLLVSHARSEDSRYDYGEIQTNLELINTYSVIIKSPVILEKVRENLNLNESVEALNSMINITSENESQVVRITVKNSDFDKAIDIANTIGNVFKTEIVNIMNIDNVSILSEAQQKNNPVPISPNRSLNIAIAFVFGIIASVCLTFFLEYFDNTIKSEDEIENELKIPVLGKISKLSSKLVAEENSFEVHANIRKETLES
ncbi:Wzz/FepE/Etk N-terminal domain-containing protein [Bacillus gobiensis]|uniref:YveK family protein n=1 Tax=Bacillus gobiensis TaxID=1441095 RepID=UPI003D1EFBE8